LFDRLRAVESIGRPLGDDRFLARIERLTARTLRAGKRGPKPKAAADGAQSKLLERFMD
jgi:putative transposase